MEKRAIFCKIEKSDGQCFGVCNHDQDIEFDGLVYHAEAALMPSEIENEIGIAMPNMEVLGGVSDGFFSYEELNQGSFLGARVTQFEYDFANQMRGRELFFGVISEIEYSQNQFRANLTAPLEALNGVFGRSYIKQCQARLGDGDCRVQLSEHMRSFLVEDVDEKSILVSGDAQDFPLRYGSIRLTDDVAGLDKFAIQEARPRGAFYELTLGEFSSEKISVGQEIFVTAGCDKSIECCAGYFDNAINFCGFPHMPGEEILSANAEKQIAKS